jgi:hypothetical protein
MKSVRYAVVGTAALAVLFAAIPVLSDVASNRAAAGQDLALEWRLAVWSALQITVYAPLMFVPLGLLALLGAWRSAPMTPAQERRLLGWWLLVGVVSPVLALAAWVAVLVPSGLPFVNIGVAFISLALVAWLAAIAVAVRVQSRLAVSGARVRGWHVAAASIPLLLLGEAALIPPALVWWTSRRAV